MKTLLIFTVAALAATAAAAQTNVGISVSVAQPGVYGRIDIGNFPAPRVAQPIIIVSAPVQQRPVYLYVPPGHQKNWKKHCGQYGACGQPVYFVQESWVQERYDERQGKPGKNKGGDKGGDKGNDKGNGKGNGQGNGQGKGN